MKIGIIGAGRVGSLLAFTLLFVPKIKEIWVYDKDENRLEGEVVDLCHARSVLPGENWPKIFKASSLVNLRENTKKRIICAGAARNNVESNRDLYRKNKKTIDNITRTLGPGQYIVTNPIEMFASEFEHKPLGLFLESVREITDGKTGGYILQKKGYTCYGIAAEIYREFGGL